MREDFFVAEFRVCQQIIIFTFSFREERVFLREFLLAFIAYAGTEDFVELKVEFHAPTFKAFRILGDVQAGSYTFNLLVLGG